MISTNESALQTRMRKIREERPVRNVTITRATPPANRHTDDATIAAERLLERFTRRTT